MKPVIKIIAVLFLSCSGVHAQEADTLAYTSYKQNVILFSDFGYNAAPFSIRYPFPNGIDKIKYRHNFKTMIGFGFSYKWFSVRLGAALIGNTRPQSEYGKASYFDIGLNFSIKKTYSEIDLRVYNGYVLKDAYKWNDSLNQLNPNDISQKITTYNVAFKMWYLDNKNFRMDPFNGIKGHYNRRVTTWYLAGRLDMYGAGNESGSLASAQLYDSTNTKTGAASLFGMDIGVIPGIGHVWRKNNWQFGGMLALGPRIQIKSYNVDGQNNGLIGIVARYDVRIVGGYSVPRFFSLISFDMDNKSISFDKFKYYQSFYALRLTLGYRFSSKKNPLKRMKE